MSAGIYGPAVELAGDGRPAARGYYTRMASDIPERVRELVHERVPSMDHIELLLLLVEHPDRQWSVDELATELRRPPAAVREDAEGLAASGLAARPAGASPARYAYAPEDARLRTAVDELVELYRRRPVTLVRLIYSRPSRSVASFANAFRLRKSED